MDNNLPQALQAMVQHAKWTQNTDGHSGVGVYRLDYNHQPSQYLKIAPSDHRDDLKMEHEKLVWAYDHIPVPEPLYFEQTDTHQYLLMSAIEGVSLIDRKVLTQPEFVINVVADALHQLHNTPIDDCPFDLTPSALVTQAQQLIDQGHIDTDFFDDPIEENARIKLNTLRQSIPPDKDLVLLHGDACLPNIIINPKTGEFKGFIDMAFLGVGNRLYDVTIAAGSVNYNLGEDWGDTFWYTYGIDPDSINRKHWEWYWSITSFL